MKKIKRKYDNMPLEDKVKSSNKKTMPLDDELADDFEVKLKETLRDLPKEVYKDI